MSYLCYGISSLREEVNTVKRMVLASGPELRLVKEVRETSDMEEAATLMAQSGWVMIAAWRNANGWRYSMGRLDVSPSHILEAYPALRRERSR